MKVLIGFGCKRERGKDEACRHIVEKYVGFRHDSFAHSLKEGIGKGVFGLSDEQLYGPLKSELDEFWQLTPRMILQLGGTEAMRRVFGEDIWVKTLLRRYNQSPLSVVVSDVRFKSEAEAIQKANGFVVRVDRNIPFNPEVDLHQSETDLDDWHSWDLVISNNATLEDFHHAVDGLVGGILL